MGERRLANDNGGAAAHHSDVEEENKTRPNKIIKYFSNGEIIDLDFSKLNKAIPAKKPPMSAAM